MQQQTVIVDGWTAEDIDRCDVVTLRWIAEQRDRLFGGDRMAIRDEHDLAVTLREESA